MADHETIQERALHLALTAAELANDAHNERLHLLQREQEERVPVAELGINEDKNLTAIMTANAQAWLQKNAASRYCRSTINRWWHGFSARK